MSLRTPTNDVRMLTIEISYYVLHHWQSSHAYVERVRSLHTTSTIVCTTMSFRHHPAYTYEEYVYHTNVCMYLYCMCAFWAPCCKFLASRRGSNIFFAFFFFFRHDTKTLHSQSTTIESDEIILSTTREVYARKRVWIITVAPGLTSVNITNSTRFFFLFFFGWIIMAALNRPTVANYEIHESVRVDTQGTFF